MTARLVGGGLALGLGLVLAALALAAPLEPGARVVPVLDVPRGLLALDARAWVSLAVVVLGLTPVVRLAGWLVAFHAEGDRSAFAAALASLALLLATPLVAAGVPGPVPPADDDGRGGGAAPVATGQGP